VPDTDAVGEPLCVGEFVWEEQPDCDADWDTDLV
jgi:hypothetical protein